MVMVRIDDLLGLKPTLNREGITGANVKKPVSKRPPVALFKLPMAGEVSPYLVSPIDAIHMMIIGIDSSRDLQLFARRIAKYRP